MSVAAPGRPRRGRARLARGQRRQLDDERVALAPLVAHAATRPRRVSRVDGLGAYSALLAARARGDRAVRAVQRRRGPPTCFVAKRGKHGGWAALPG